MSERGCTDQVIGDILSGWRYDISGVSPDMRTVYEHHLTECSHCSSRQRLHRTIDVALMALSTLSILIFLLATAVIHRGPWQHLVFADIKLRQLSVVLTLQAVSVGGFLFSLLMWVLVAIATPAPGFLNRAMQQRRDHTSRVA